MKQFMPMKPVKHGIKVWECAEASSGFVCDFQVCPGKRQDGVTEKNLGYLVVHDLTQNFTGKNHHIFCDNFFTSVSLPETITITYVEPPVLSVKTSLKNSQIILK